VERVFLNWWNVDQQEVLNQGEKSTTRVSLDSRYTYR